MSGQGPSRPLPIDVIERAFRDKALAELAAADRLAPGSDIVASAGDPFAEVFLVKGEPGPAEGSGGEALSGPDGTALRKALTALGFDPGSVFASVSRPEAGLEAESLRARLRAQVEAVDPWVVVALDAVAATDVAAAFELDALPFGRRVYAGGRQFVAVEGFEASLGDERAKLRIWRQLQACEVRPPAL